MKKEEMIKKVDEITQRYFKNMQLEMQRFAKDIMELMFEEDEK